MNSLISVTHDSAPGVENPFDLLPGFPVARAELVGIRHLIIESANESMLQLLGMEESVLGNAFADELDQFFDIHLLNRVVTSCFSITDKERCIRFCRGGNPIPERAWFNISYEPRFDQHAQVNGILVFAFEVTDFVLSRRRVDEYEFRFRRMVLQAPVPICILKGEDLLIESVNEMMLNIWGRTYFVLKTRLKEALPELTGQGCLEVMAGVYATGNKFIGNEVRSLFNHKGQLKEYFLNLMIKPILNERGEIIYLMAVAIDVTKQVRDRNAFYNALDLLKFSVEAANIGTWSKDLHSGEVIISGRHKELFGFAVDQEVDTDQLMLQIPADQREMVAKEMSRVYSVGGLYDITFSTEGFKDQKIRWVRALGSVIKDNNGIPSYFSGVSIETTQQKEDELRKNHFISIVSHELKTPLTSVKGYIQLLLQTAEKSEDLFASTMLEKAEMRLDKMTSLINGFLNVSQLESGKIQLNLQEFKLDELIREVADEMNLQNKNSNIIYKPQEMIVLRADREKIGQVITNLLNNATKYSPSSSQVQIESVLSNGIISLNVQDSGIGISAEDQEHVFDRYFRVNSLQNEVISGFGIGLYLCREIIKRHGGTISVKSIPEQGSVFTFNLPAFPS